VTRVALERVSIRTDATIRHVLEVVDRSAMKVALVVDDDGLLLGMLTDGDVRRALLGGATLDDDALPFATKTPQTVSAGSSRALVLDLMRANRIDSVPETDERGRLVGLHTLSDVIGSQPLPNPAVVMAGGRGTRLGPITENRPKPLVEVAGRSIIEWIVLNLVGGGIRHVYVSVNHLADMVVEHLGDGSRLGCTVDYLREDPANPLGTAGSLALIEREHLDHAVPILVMNGDLMVQFEPQQLLDFHEDRAAEVTVATRPYQHQVPFGVVTCEPGSDRITGIREKPTFTADVSAGVYAVSPAALDHLRPEQPSDMPDLVQACLDAGTRVSSWRMPSDWIDIGTPGDLARAKGQV
jgi:dTDP-glucose pyrophosphorylase